MCLPVSENAMFVFRSSISRGVGAYIVLVDKQNTKNVSHYNVFEIRNSNSVHEIY